MKVASQLKFLTIIFAMVTLMSCQKDVAREFTHYKIDMSVDPEEQYIEVDCFMDISPKNPGDTLYFYLHRQLEIENLTVNGTKAIIISRDTSDIRYMPGATKYALKIDQPDDKSIGLHLKYAGHMTESSGWGASVIGKDWTEMGLYFPWYPYNRDFNPITYEVNVKHDQKYKTFMIGNETKEDGFSQYRTDSPGSDIVLCMSKELKIISREIDQYTLKLAHTTLSDKMTDSISYDMELILSLFSKWFPPGNNSVSIVESMRESGGGYARLGGLYLAGLNETDYFELRKPYTRYLAHETAHLWWYRANTNIWEDWLNEGLAEYSALMVLRELYGQDYFNTWIENKRKKAEGVGPVWHTNRNGDQAYTILYDKAPLLLYELENRIGADSLKKFMRNLILNKVSATDQFGEILKDQEGTETAQWFLNKLKS